MTLFGEQGVGEEIVKEELEATLFFFCFFLKFVVDINKKPFFLYYLPFSEL